MKSETKHTSFAPHVVAKFCEYISITVSRVQYEIKRILFAAVIGHYENFPRLHLCLMFRGFYTAFIWVSATYNSFVHYSATHTSVVHDSVTNTIVVHALATYTSTVDVSATYSSVVYP